MNKLNTTLDELRTLVLEAFKNTPESQYLDITSEVARIAVQKGITPNPHQGHVFGAEYQLCSYDQDRVREVIWDLIIERVVTIGINAANPNWPWLKLTEYGNKVVIEGNPTPHDPSGFLSRLKQEVPNIDPIIIVYLEESLRTYNIGALLSSTITLGCASEKALLVLIEVFGNAIQDTKRQEKFIGDTQGKVIKRQFDVLVKNLNGLKGHLPGDILDGLDTILLGIFEMVRNYRNDAGHPTGKHILREQVYANLQVFVSYCKKIYQLQDYFSRNDIT